MLDHVEATTAQEALSHPKWKQAMHDEIATQSRNQI